MTMRSPNKSIFASMLINEKTTNKKNRILTPGDILMATNMVSINFDDDKKTNMGKIRIISDIFRLPEIWNISEAGLETAVALIKHAA